MSEFDDALNAFATRLAEVKAETPPVQTADEALAEAYKRFPWLQPFVGALDAEVKKLDAGNRVFIVAPSYDVNDRKVSGRIFLQAPKYGEKVVHFIVQGSRMRLSGVGPGDSNLFAPEDKKAVTDLIARAAAEFFGKT